MNLQNTGNSHRKTDRFGHRKNSHGRLKFQKGCFIAFLLGTDGTRLHALLLTKKELEAPLRDLASIQTLRVLLLI